MATNRATNREPHPNPQPHPIPRPADPVPMPDEPVPGPEGPVPGPARSYRRAATFKLAVSPWFFGWAAPCYARAPLIN